MEKKAKKLPDFNKMTREEEARWWDTHDLGDYWDNMEKVDMDFSKAVWEHRPMKETIIVRVDKPLKDKLKIAAHNKGLNPSTFARMILTEKLQTL